MTREVGEGKVWEESVEKAAVPLAAAASTPHCMRRRSGVCYRSGCEIKMEIPVKDVVDFYIGGGNSNSHLDKLSDLSRMAHGADYGRAEALFRGRSFPFSGRAGSARPLVKGKTGVKRRPWLASQLKTRRA